MKVIACNMRYHVTGGPERYMFSLQKMLHTRGHEFIPFSVQYDANQKTEFSPYFVSPPGGDTQHVFFKDLNLTTTQKFKFAMNAIYHFEAKKNLERLIRDTRADLVQTLQIHTVLSYSILDAAKKMGLPVVSRMSNYQLMCPAELFLRDHQVCEACKNNLYYAVKHKCIQNSTLASLVRASSLKFHFMKHTFDKVDRFIVPSRFLRQKMIEYGFHADRVTYIPSFVTTQDIEPNYTFENYIAYSGRLAVEKGLQDLIDGFAKIQTKVKLLLIGDDQNDEARRLKEYVTKNNLKQIEFLGYKSFSDMKPILQNAMFTVCPSKWYENTPMSIYESFAMGKPVVGANLGSIPEQIINGKTGLLFEPGNPDDIAEKLNSLISQPERLPAMGREARRIIEENHSPDAHWDRLSQVYFDVLR